MTSSLLLSINKAISWVSQSKECVILGAEWKWRLNPTMPVFLWCPQCHTIGFKSCSVFIVDVEFIFRLWLSVCLNLLVLCVVSCMHSCAQFLFFCPLPPPSLAYYLNATHLCLTGCAPSCLQGPASFLLCWICFAATFCPFLIPLCSNTIRSFTFLFFVILSACWHLCRRICQVYLIYGLPFLCFRAFPLFLPKCVIRCWALMLYSCDLSGGFHPLGETLTAPTCIHQTFRSLLLPVSHALDVWTDAGFCLLLLFSSVLFSHALGFSFGRMPTLVWQWPF